MQKNLKNRALPSRAPLLRGGLPLPLPDMSLCPGRRSAETHLHNSNGAWEGLPAHQTQSPPKPSPRSPLPVNGVALLLCRPQNATLSVPLCIHLSQLRSQPSGPTYSPQCYRWSFFDTIPLTISGPTDKGSHLKKAAHKYLTSLIPCISLFLYYYFLKSTYLFR